MTEHVPPDEFPVNDELMKIQSVQKSRPELGVTSFVNAYSKFGGEYTCIITYNLDKLRKCYSMA